MGVKNQLHREPVGIKFPVLRNSVIMMGTVIILTVVLQLLKIEMFMDVPIDILILIMLITLIIEYLVLTKIDKVINDSLD